jgi:hypothetical protein
MLVNLLEFASVYFLDSSLFKGLRAENIKKLHPVLNSRFQVAFARDAPPLTLVLRDRNAQLLYPSQGKTYSMEF